VEKQYVRGVAYSECEFVALGIQHAMRMRHIILSSVVCPAVQFIFTLPHERKIFQNKVLNTKYIFCLSLHLRLKHFSFQEEMSEIWSKMFIGLHVKYQLLLSDLHKT
jgi:hypothetical protein